VNGRAGPKSLRSKILAGVRDHRTGREDRLGARFLQRIIILRRNHAADHDHDVAAAFLLERDLISGTKRKVAAASEETPTICTSFSTACRRASPGVANSGPISTSKPRSAKADANHLLAAVVAVLADLGDENARPAAFLGLEGFDQTLQRAARSPAMAPTSRL